VHVRGLKIAVIAGRLQARAPELRSDIFGGKVEAARRRRAPFEQVGCNKRKMPA
jgi:hypothetical protein